MNFKRINVALRCCMGDLQAVAPSGGDTLKVQTYGISKV